LKEMEAEMEKLVKEKEHSKPMEVIPLSAFPLRSEHNVTSRSSIGESTDVSGKDG
jgi:hypothetical protein